jgi:8-oxo-dGTP pyrophosphatase MutT (NUDIX family)
MDGYWPQGGHGTQQPGTSSPGGDGPRGRPPNGVGKAAAISGIPVDASVVYAQLLKRFPPKAIAWARGASWILADVPQDRIDRDDALAWAASHDPARVARFARRYRKDPGSVKPAVCVLERGAARVTVVDGHHRDEGAQAAGMPLRAYVGFLGAAGMRAALETHSSQIGGNKAAAPAAATVAAGLAVLAADTGRVLLLQRALDDTDPASGTWEFPGGHVEPGEMPLQAALREWGEETGCQPPRGTLTGHWESANGVYEGFVLTVPSEDGVPVFEDRDEVWNPDDPDGDVTEALAWWDPALLRDNPAVRAELAADLDRVEEALQVTP